RPAPAEPSDLGFGPVHPDHFSDLSFGRARPAPAEPSDLGFGPVHPDHSSDLSFGRARGISPVTFNTMGEEERADAPYGHKDTRDPRPTHHKDRP
ncbi:MAG: hypothetical protein ACR2HR_01020, partial [Euzebya sp.]